MPDLDALLTEAERAVWERLEIEVERSLRLDLNGSWDRAYFRGLVADLTAAALRSVQVPVTEEWLEEHVIGVLDDESHEDVCSCGEWPESCVTYGVRRPWSHDASRAIEYIARNFTVLPSPGTTTEEE